MPKRKNKWLSRSEVRRLLMNANFHLMTVDVLHACEFPGKKRSAAESWLRRRCSGGWLASASLDEHRVYYYLTTKSVLYLKRICKLRISRACARPLSANRKFEKYALLLFCLGKGKSTRSAYRPSHHPERFSDIAAHIAQGKADPLRHKLFYLDENIVGFLIVDRGQRQMIRTKVQPRVYSILRWKSFREALNQQQLRLTIVTVSVGRQRELTHEIELDPPPMPYEIIVMPELEPLFPSHHRPQSKEQDHGSSP